MVNKTFIKTHISPIQDSLARPPAPHTHAHFFASSSRSRTMPTSATPFPDPPSFYTLYGRVSDGTNGADAEDSQGGEVPTPPEPVVGAYSSFGAQHHTAPWHDPDHGYAATSGFEYPMCYDENVDAREEIVALVRGAGERFSRAIAHAVDAPSAVDDDIRDVHAILNNAHKLINERIRPSQAMSTLEHALKVQTEQKLEAARALRDATAKARETCG